MTHRFLRLQPSAKLSHKRGEISYLIAPTKEPIASKEAPFEQRSRLEIEKEFLSVRQRTLELVNGEIFPRFAESPGYFPPELVGLLNQTSVFFLDILGPIPLGVDKGQTLEEVLAFRQYVDDRVTNQFYTPGQDTHSNLLAHIAYGIQLEQRAQEYFLVELQALLCKMQVPFANISFLEDDATPMNWITVDAGLETIGSRLQAGAFDDEYPEHTRYVYPFKIASRLVTNIEFAEFIYDGGYTNKDLWDKEGWVWLKECSNRAPFYWSGSNLLTIAGTRELKAHEPVCYINYYEAAAYAKWAGARLPTEFEWEVASAKFGYKEGNFYETGIFHPIRVRKYREEMSESVFQLAGDSWEWTTSAFMPYPRYEETANSANPSQFSVHSLVLRGGSCLSAKGSYRNSARLPLSPKERRYCSGIRLIREDL